MKLPKKKSKYELNFELVLQAYKESKSVIKFVNCNPFITGDNKNNRIDFTYDGKEEPLMFICCYEDGSAVACYQDTHRNIFEEKTVDKVTSIDNAKSIFRWLGALINKYGIS